MGYVGSTVCWSILFGNTMNMQKSSLDFGGQSHKIQIVQEFYLSDQWSVISDHQLCRSFIWAIRLDNWLICLTKYRPFRIVAS